VLLQFQSNQTKGENYERFVAGLDDVRANILLLRASDIMWQKERLLKLAIATLQRACTKITWLDWALLFINPSWFERRAADLEDVPVPQPFGTVVHLLPGRIQFCGQPRESLVTNDFERHGHTGFAWAGRREWMEDVGLYDASKGPSSRKGGLGLEKQQACHARLGQLSGSKTRLRRGQVRNLARKESLQRLVERNAPSAVMDPIIRRS